MWRVVGLSSPPALLLEVLLEIFAGARRVSFQSDASQLCRANPSIASAPCFYAMIDSSRLVSGSKHPFLPFTTHIVRARHTWSDI